MYKASRYGLQANGVNPVLCLPGRKSVEFQLFDKSLMRERILLEVAPSLACRLRIPVDRETADRVLCIRSRELVKLKLLHKTFSREVVLLEVVLRLAHGVLLTHRTEREISGGLSAGHTDTADPYESGGGQDNEMLLVHRSGC
jgi:hypothetical protein